MNDYLRSIPEVVEITTGANVLDIKQAEGALTLREFAVGFLGYQPGWITLLYGVRAAIVPFLGLRQNGLPRAVKKAPSELPMQSGQMFGFFRVEHAAENRFWIASANDSHLAAYLGIVCEPLGDGRNHFYVVTAVHYRNWAGPVYFNLIRPFHHLVVGQMTRAGLQAQA
jgi:hypothetical protein